MTTVRESAMYKLDLVGVQEVRWDKRHTAGYGGILFSMQKGMKIINWEQDSFVHQGMLLAVKRVEFVSDRMSYVVLTGCWCHFIVLNAHAPTEKKKQ
jgi:hypothetical protein